MVEICLKATTMDQRAIFDLLNSIATSASTGKAFQFKQQTDVGRTGVNLYANGAATGATTVEQIITLSIASGVSAVTTSTSWTIPANKTFRITSVTFSVRGNAVATAQSTVFNLRYNSAGAAIVTSTPIFLSATIATPATALAFDSVTITPGNEIVGDGVASICFTVNSAFVTNAPTVSCTISGFTYTT